MRDKRLASMLVYWNSSFQGILFIECWLYLNISTEVQLHHASWACTGMRNSLAGTAENALRHNSPFKLCFKFLANRAASIMTPQIGLMLQLKCPRFPQYCQVHKVKQITCTKSQGDNILTLMSVLQIWSRVMTLLTIGTTNNNLPTHVQRHWEFPIEIFSSSYT